MDESKEKEDNKEKESKVSKFQNLNSSKLMLIVFGLLAVAAIGLYLYSNGIIDPASITSQLNQGAAAATVNGEKITSTELASVEQQIAASRGVDLSSADEEAATQIRQEALEGLITQKLLLQKAESSDVEVSDEKIDEQIQGIKDQYETEEEFQQELNARGLTMDKLREQIGSDLLIQKYIEQNVNFEELEVTDEEVQQFYDQNVPEGEDSPPLEEISSQIDQMIIQQKQQEKVQQFIQELRSEADIQIVE